MKTEISELRVSLTVRHYERAVAMYRDALELPVVLEWDEPSGAGVVLAAGRGTIEIVDERQAEHIDLVEQARERSGDVRIALETPDSEATARRLVEYAEVGDAVETPWGDRNVRVRPSEGVQLTLFTPPPSVDKGYRDTEANKQLVRRLVDEVVNQRNVDALDEVARDKFAEVARRWISPFRSSFPDFRMEIVRLVAQDDIVVGHFKCSGTHRAEWLGVTPTGRRFEDVDEIYVFRVRDGRLVSAVGVEDNLSRMRQLGIRWREPESDS
jgi:predicted ester cyclase